MDKRSDAGHNAFRLLAIAAAITLTVNIIFWSLPASFNMIIYGTIQFVWPVLSIIALMSIYYTTGDKNTKFAAHFFAIALVPWTVTLLLWSIILPQLFDSDLAYYVSGFGFLCTYAILAYGLMRLKRSKQWYIPPSMDFLINVITAMAAIGVSAFILAFADPASPRLPDVLILYLYLIADAIVLTYVARLLYMGLGDDLKYIVMVIGIFVFVNSLADFIYELRWLLPLNYIYSIKTVRVTDFVYNVSLIFMALALMMYDSSFKRKAMDEVNKKLYDTKHLMDSVVMQSPDATCICDPSGGIVLVNDVFLDLLGIRRADIPIGFSVFAHLSGMGEWTGPFVSKLKSGESALVPRLSLKPRKNGRAAVVSLKAYPVLGKDNAIYSYMFTIEDITQRLSIEDDLRESKEQAELYVNLMAHDINNMNQVALGFLEMAEDKLASDGKLDKGEIGLLRKPIESLKRSSTLIDNVKKLQKEKSGQLGDKMMDIGEVLLEVRKQYESVPGRVVSINCKDGSGCRVMANDLLKEVFSNLVGNAIKHSNSPVNINIISACAYEDGKKFCRVEVEDDGPGIPDMMKQQIFDRYCNERSAAGGKGLGLYLVKTLVSDYRGKIWVEDRVPGDHTRGSRFVVLLPSI